MTEVNTLYSLLFSGNYDTGRALFILLVISPVSPCPLEIMVFDEKRRQKPLCSYTYSGIINCYIVMYSVYDISQVMRIFYLKE